MGKTTENNYNGFFNIYINEGYNETILNIFTDILL